jgi:hypothetical protein
MNNFDKLHQEQDEFIKKKFQEDKITSQPVFDDFTNYIEHTNIKQKKYTYKQRKIVILLLILLIISICINIFLASRSYEDSATTENTSIYSNTLENSNAESNTITNTTENKVSNTENSVTVDIDKSNSVQNTSKSETINATITNFSDVDLDELKITIEAYSYAIQRVSYDEDNLESNTILLLIAKRYFDSNSPKNSSQIAKYAQTAENVHTYLKELTGKDFSNVDYIQSYNNYIGYTQSSKSYVYGKDYSTITKESYTCSDLKINNQSGDTFTAEAEVTRLLDDKQTNYKLTFTFKINENYTYQKYCITSLKSKNTSFYPDNTVHFVDISAVEEGEN